MKYKLVNQDNEKEFLRYNSRSKNILNKTSSQDYIFSTIDDYPLYLQEPFRFLYAILEKNKKIGTNVLDLCAGDGIHAIEFAKIGFNILATDIAPNSIEIAKIRAKKANLTNIHFQVANAEYLDFPPESFDIITIVGSLSYLDYNLFIGQVNKVLKPGGKLLILDSYNHNPVYILNRVFHYIKGERTLSTLKRMPSKKTIKRLTQIFSDVNVSYFGIFAFIGKPLSLLVGENKTAKIISKLDKTFHFLRSYAFKIVIEVSN